MVDHLIEPVIRQRRIEAPDPLFALREVCRTANGTAPEQLARACEQILDQRKVTVLPCHFEDAIARRSLETPQERKHREARDWRELAGLGQPSSAANVSEQKPKSYYITRTENGPQFEAWLAWHRAERLAGRPNLATLMETHGAFRAPSEWPPTSQEAAA